MKNLVIVSAVFASVHCALGADLYVATNGNDANTCHSPGDPCLTVQAAVNKSADGDRINVASGDYPDPISIFQRTNLTIVGSSSGASLSSGNVPLGGALVSILQSKNIVFQNLTVSGDPNGVTAFLIFHSTAIDVNQCIIQNADTGFFNNELSTVSIDDSIVQNNGIGVRVDNNSVTDINSAPFSTGTSTIQGNGQGVYVRSGSLRVHGATVIQNNGVGINGESGEIKSCCEDGDTRKIVNNGIGVQGRDVNIFLRGPLLMEGNQTFAIRQFGGLVRLQDRVTIRNNGGSGGVAVVNVSGHLQLTGGQSNDVQVVQNPGIGILVRDNGSARVSNSLIANNGGNGMRVEALSTATLLDATAVMRDNGNYDFFCAPNSFGHGSDAGVKKMYAPGFDKSPSPGGP